MNGKAEDQTGVKDGFRLIPTDIRYRISKELSFPIGAELVSEALNGVPGYDRLILSFWAVLDRATPPRVREILQDDRPLVILDVFGHHISVKPVPKENKWVVKNVLYELGLPRLRQWFIDYEAWSKGEPDLFLYRTCKIFVCIAEEKLNFWEDEARGFRPRNQ